MVRINMVHTIFLVFEKRSESGTFVQREWGQSESATIAHFDAAGLAEEIQVRGGRVTQHRALEPVQSRDDFIRALTEACVRNYIRGQRNAVVFSMHCYIQSLWAFNGSRPLVPWVDAMVAHGIWWEFIVFDCCFMSTLNAALVVRPVTRYLLGCQSASPDYGFSSPPSARNTLTALKQMARTFIERNNRLNDHYTDAVILDLTWVEPLYDSLRTVALRRLPAALSEPEYKVLYDLTTLLALMRVKNAYVKRVVRFYMQSESLRRLPWSARLHGISIGLGKHLPRGLRQSNQ